MADIQEDNRLGRFLKDRRAKLDPAAFGIPLTRRRTPGLRREEVAQRANVSVTWYTWLEQGRGGAPSADVLDRVSKALMLTDVEREHLYLIGLGRAPDVRYQPQQGVSPRLQNVLDALEQTPAMIRTHTWDVVAWNRASSAVLTDYASLPPGERNILRLIFSDPRVRNIQADWESVARFVVGAFRADVVRAGAAYETTSLVEELCQLSPDFERLWKDHDVLASDDLTKRLKHPVAGWMSLECSTFAVDGRADLAMMVYHPASAEDREKVRALIDAQHTARSSASRD
ncbi:helix-turn-helix domain-containing protein [Labrenzia sp. 5N]|uniref:helix-turn-helix transcriptional regulator n=1 Tax=Labrenzia sp. 5N TaxID=2723402 RepID=UPI0014461A94|nr:helix-turn-helix transcriptional regulator [Labrenzia sp. 5N]MCR9284088.1 helix-turn-helix transcriptional regulator [Paracoccaceae bacterium]NKX64805.1 helix-turn-helix domain-containing protein [Labrenzia sp. 5N]